MKKFNLSKHPFPLIVLIEASFFLLFACFPQSSLALSQIRAERPQQRLDEFFQKFDQNPLATMGQIPPKWDSHGIQVEESSFFSDHEIVSRQFLDKKDRLRQNLCPESLLGEPCEGSSAVPFEEINPLNRVDRFLENSKEFSVSKLSTAVLRQAQVKEQPWSGDYWPTYRGGIASRYADKEFPSLPSWKDYEKYFSTMLQNTNYKDAEVLKTLSPSEKYDLLVGDFNFGLTQYSIQNSTRSADEDGEIESWVGICHGWAPAAMKLSRPEKPVSVTLQDGRNLTFFPDDLKALASLLWANADFGVHFSGGRCNVKEPKMDDIGRITDPQCWDTNPASFHLILLNQVGFDRRSFVMDATFDYQVWNQPVVGYKLRYFNPETRKDTLSLEEALIPISEFTKDKFKKFRSLKTKKIVGVAMNLSYSVERFSDHRELDRPEDDNILSVEYYYDLEIDDEGQIIGGEWYQNAHPDFLWSPTVGAKAQAPDEISSSAVWDPSQVVPRDLQRMAKRAAAGGFPLERILRPLFERSKLH